MSSRRLHYCDRSTYVLLFFFCGCVIHNLLDVVNQLAYCVVEIIVHTCGAPATALPLVNLALTQRDQHFVVTRWSHGVGPAR